MAEYEVVREIKNLCRNNQMRDIFFEEVECDDPAEYLRRTLKGKQIELTVEQHGENTTIFATVDGMIEKYVFTKI